MKVSRRGGRLRLRLDDIEVGVLASLLGELEALLDRDDDPSASADPVLARLFPAGYAEDSAAAEFAAMTHPALRTERSQRIQACLADITSSSDVDLSDPETATCWIQTLNDLRLALGTRIGVDADSEVDEADLEDQPRMLYSWLTAVQDRIVTALMG